MLKKLSCFTFVLGLVTPLSLCHSADYKMDKLINQSNFTEITNTQNVEHTNTLSTDSFSYKNHKPMSIIPCYYRVYMDKCKENSPNNALDSFYFINNPNK